MRCQRQLAHLAIDSRRRPSWPWWRRRRWWRPSSCGRRWLRLGAKGCRGCRWLRLRLRLRRRCWRRTGRRGCRWLRLRLRLRRRLRLGAKGRRGCSWLRLRRRWWRRLPWHNGWHIRCWQRACPKQEAMPKPCIGIDVIDCRIASLETLGGQDNSVPSHDQQTPCQQLEGESLRVLDGCQRPAGSDAYGNAIVVVNGVLKVDGGHPTTSLKRHGRARSKALDAAAHPPAPVCGMAVGDVAPWKRWELLRLNRAANRRDRSRNVWVVPHLDPRAPLCLGPPRHLHAGARCAANGRRAANGERNDGPIRSGGGA